MGEQKMTLHASSTVVAPPHAIRSAWDVSKREVLIAVGYAIAATFFTTMTAWFIRLGFPPAFNAFIAVPAILNGAIAARRVVRVKNILKNIPA